MSARKQSRKERPLASGTSLFGLSVGATLLAGVLLVTSHRREQWAAKAEPNSLSLAYLRLELAFKPSNSELRLGLAQKLLQAGQVDDAHATLAPLLTNPVPKDVQDQRARRLLVRIEQARFSSATNAREKEEAAAALAAAIQSIDLSALSIEEIQRLANIYAGMGEVRLRARLLGLVARRDSSDLESLVQAADAAYLEAEEPMEAARLHAEMAERTAEPGHATLALTRAMAADRPSEAMALYQNLSKQFPHEISLHERGLQISAGLDDRQSLAIAERLLAEEPNATFRHRHVAIMAEYVGNAIRAQEEYSWLARHGGTAKDHQRALELAKANWDLGAVVALGDGLAEIGKLGRDQILKRVALYEALGDGERALRLVERAMQRAEQPELADDLVLWQMRTRLEAQTGRGQAAALRTLEALAERHGESRERSYERAHLALSLGRPAQALGFALEAPSPRDITYHRTILWLAEEAGDSQQSRRALEAITQLPEATEEDYFQLYEADLDRHDKKSAMDMALAGLRRFRTHRMLELAVYASQSTGDESLALDLLTRAEATRHPLIATSSYWRLRIGLHQVMAHRAIRSRSLDDARRHLGIAERLFSRAAVLAPGEDVYQQLRATQRAETLTVAMLGDDLRELGRAYDAQAATLPPRQRVSILHRLNRDEDAITTAIEAGRSPDTSPEDRVALEADARALALGWSRRAWTGVELLHLPGLAAQRVSANAEYAWSRVALAASAEATELRPDGLPDVGHARELMGQVTAGYKPLALTVGLVARENASVRPLAQARVRVSGRKGTRFEAAAAVHEPATDSALLRMIGVRDELSMEGTLPISQGWYVTARTAGQAYTTRDDRRRLGEGVTLSAGVGHSITLPWSNTSGNIRLAGYSAQRQAAPDAGGAAIPAGTTWAGVGATFTRGNLGTPPPLGLPMAWLLDATLGWLWPQENVGWSARAGVGISILGSDQLSASARTSNVVGTSPGRSAYSVGVDYTIGLW